MATTNPARPIEPVAEQAAVMNSIDPDMLASLIEGLVNKRIDEEKAKQAASNPVIVAEERAPKVAAPKNYKTHWRNDVSPECILTVRHMNEDGTPGAVVRGRTITFRRGHGFTMNQAEDDFMNWMVNAPTHDPYDQNKVVGGNPAFYVADGNEVTQCEVSGCTEVFVAGSTGYKAHLKAAHGIVR